MPQQAVDRTADRSDETHESLALWVAVAVGSLPRAHPPPHMLASMGASSWLITLKSVTVSAAPTLPIVSLLDDDDDSMTGKCHYDVNC